MDYSNNANRINSQLPQHYLDSTMLTATQAPQNALSAAQTAQAIERANEEYAYMGSEDLAELISGQSLANREFEIQQNQALLDWQTNANAIAMQFSSDEAQKAREWQEYMSNSSWQRSVDDMVKAGLNPILAYGQGGASTPSSPAPSGVTSSGSKATLSDKGYDYAKLLLDLYKNESTHSTNILGKIIDLFGDVAGAAGKLAGS